jgi:hypothetical protein
MKTKHFLVTAMIGVALAGMIITGCKKETTADTDATAAQDDANASFMLNDSKTISDGAAKGQANERILGACGAINRRDTLIGGVTDTLVDIAFPGGCVSPDGRTRKGHILFWWNGKGYFQDSASVTETWVNYSVYSPSSGTTITMGNGSSRTLTNIGKDSAGDCSWKFTASLTLNYSGATTGTATWSSTRTNVLTAVSGVYYYVINGNASGTSRTGVAYTLTITSPLYWTAYWSNIFYGNYLKICDCFESGTVQYSRTGKTNALYLQFTSGIGNCLHTATATINGNNYNIILP